MVNENQIDQGTEMQGGEAVARMLMAFHVGPIFGMGGFQLLPMYEAARTMGMQHYLINDERVAAFAADAYAKVSGRVGSADAALGPGATNLVTGLGEAFNAGTPMVCIIGDTHRAHSWKNMTQEVRQIDILRPVCKELIRVEMIERIPELIRRAFAVATSGRPGPVVVDLPEDIMHESYKFYPSDFVVDPANERVPALRCRPDKQAVAAAATLLANAKSPLIIAGGGIHISGANNELTKFVTATNIPVAHTLSGKGAIACTNRLNAGLFGRYDRIANKLIEEADVLFVVGCKLGEIATKRYSLLPEGQKIIHLDSLAEEFGRTTSVDIKLWGDALCGIQDMSEALGERATTLHERLQPYADDVVKRMVGWREEVSERLHSDERPINMARLLTELNNSLPDDAILVADGGFAAHWGGLLYDTKQAGRGFLLDRGFASIGYGLPGAIGAKLAAPDRTVMALTGDSGFCMVIGDLETAKRLNLDITIIVVNNAASGYVKALQHLVYGAGHYHSSDLHEVDFASVANSFGCTGIRVEDPGKIREALQKAMATEGPVVIDVIVTRDPAKMLPGVDNRAAVVKKGDRIA